MGSSPWGRARTLLSPGLLFAISVAALLAATAVWSAGTPRSTDGVLVQAGGDAAALSRLQNERRGLVNAIQVDQASAVLAQPAESAASSEAGEEAAGEGSATDVAAAGEDCGKLCQMRKMIIKARSAVDHQADAECSQLAGDCVTIPPIFHPAVRGAPAKAAPARSTPVVYTHPAPAPVVSAPVRSAPVYTGSVQPGAVQTGSFQTGSVQTGSVQAGSVQTGAIQRGRIQYTQPPAAPAEPPAAPAAQGARPRIYQHIINRPPVPAPGVSGGSGKESGSRGGPEGSDEAGDSRGGSGGSDDADGSRGGAAEGKQGPPGPAGEPGLNGFEPHCPTI